jgi:hypothetical protein
MSVELGADTHFRTGTVVESALPISMFAKFNPHLFPTAGPGAVLVTICSPTGAVFHGTTEYALAIGSTTFIGHRVIARQRATGVLSGFLGEAAAGTYALDTEQSAGAVFLNNSSRTAYFDGVSGGANTDSVNAVTLLSDTLIADDQVLNKQLRGCLRNVCVWSAALNDADMLSLHNGTAPTSINPGNIVLYVPFINAGSAANAFAWNGSAIAAIDPLIQVGSNMETCAGGNVGSSYVRIMG